MVYKLNLPTFLRKESLENIFQSEMVFSACVCLYLSIYIQYLCSTMHETATMPISLVYRHYLRLLFKK